MGIITDGPDCAGMGLSAFSTSLHHQCVSRPVPEGKATGAPAGAATLVPTALPGSTVPPIVVKPGEVEGPVHHDMQNGTAGIVNREGGNGTNATTIAGGEESGGIPTWVWVILAAMLLVGIPVLAYFLCFNKAGKKGSKKKKSKRAVARDESNEDSFVTDASELEMQQQPLVRAEQRAGQGPEIFDLIDANHDGIISMNEWNAAMGGRASMQAAPVMTYAVPQNVQQSRVVNPVSVMQGTMTTAAAPVAQRQQGMPGMVTVSPYGTNIQYAQGANMQYTQPGMFR